MLVCTKRGQCEVSREMYSQCRVEELNRAFWDEGTLTCQPGIKRGVCVQRAAGLITSNVFSAVRVDKGGGGERTRCRRGPRKR